MSLVALSNLIATTETEALTDLVELSSNALDMEELDINLSFYLDSSMKSDYGHFSESFCEE